MIEWLESAKFVCDRVVTSHFFTSTTSYIWYYDDGRGNKVAIRPNGAGDELTVAEAQELSDMLAQMQQQSIKAPVCVFPAQRGMRVDWMFEGQIFRIDVRLEVQDVRLAVLRERQRFSDSVEKLRSTSNTSKSTPQRREAIAEAVRHEVWRRDQGQCVECGSKEKLEFDHIIPFSAGGSSTARNLQLLCELCNRRKAASI